MKLSLLAFHAEMQKGFRLLWSYRFNSVAELIGMAIVFVGISFLLGRGEIEAEEVASTLLGYLVWFFGTTAISDMSYDLTEEARAGTVEQMFMSPVPMGVIVLGRVCATMLIALIEVLLVGAAVILVMNLSLPMRPQGVPVFVLTMIGLLGFGFVMGGIALIYKQVNSIANLVQTMLIFMTGALIPVSFFPQWLEILSKLLPSTQGIIVLRHVMLENQSLLSAWNDGSLIFLTLNSAIYFIGGWLFFLWCEKIAKRQGTLGQY
jgi:ABC-2 type transport system permease protein